MVPLCAFPGGSLMTSVIFKDYSIKAGGMVNGGSGRKKMSKDIIVSVKGSDKL